MLKLFFYIVDVTFKEGDFNALRPLFLITGEAEELCVDLIKLVHCG